MVRGTDRGEVGKRVRGMYRKKVTTSGDLNRPKEANRKKTYRQGQQKKVGAPPEGWGTRTRRKNASGEGFRWLKGEGRAEKDRKGGTLPAGRDLGVGEIKPGGGRGGGLRPVCLVAVIVRKNPPDLLGNWGWETDGLLVVGWEGGARKRVR